MKRKALVLGLLAVMELLGCALIITGFMVQPHSNLSTVSRLGGAAIMLLAIISLFSVLGVNYEKER